MLLCAQGLVFAIHNDVVLARADTRQLARDWMVENVPAGTKVVVEPVVPDAWASDTGRALRATGNGARWRKWPTSRSRLQRRRHAAQGRARAGRQARGLRAHAAPGLVRHTSAAATAGS